MSEDTSIRATIYFEAALHNAIRLKAAHTRRSVSEVVNDAVRLALREDQEDLAAFEDRVAEPRIFELFQRLTSNGSCNAYSCSERTRDQ